MALIPARCLCFDLPFVTKSMLCALHVHEFLKDFLLLARDPRNQPHS